MPAVVASLQNRFYQGHAQGLPFHWQMGTDLQPTRRRGRGESGANHTVRKSMGLET